MPVSLSIVSRRFTDLPMSFQSLGSLSDTFAGGVSFAAASATLPYVVLRPEGLCVITLLAALHSEAGTFHALAAAWISMIRAVAPPSRTYWCESRMPRLPPVEKSPQARLRFTLWPGVGYSVFTFDQSHSSSSATIWARPVNVPGPISERAIRMTTVSSGRMTTQAFTSGEPSWARTTLAPNGILRPRARPAPAAALPMTKERRLSFGGLGIMARPPYAFAAAWMASRTCWKVPHRQMLVILASISASVGFGFSFRRAATAMIMPAWQ